MIHGVGRHGRGPKPRQIPGILTVRIAHHGIARHAESDHMIVILACLATIIGALTTTPFAIEGDAAFAAERVVVLEHWTNFA
jgi:hypothetical protein